MSENQESEKLSAVNFSLIEADLSYKNLRDLLRAEKWREADYETYLIMLRAVGGREGEILSPNNIAQFPCSDLQLIDQLWAELSNHRFGFRVQQQIWHEVGRSYEQFGDRVGWRVNSAWIPYDKLTFHLSAPPGHLPSGWVETCSLELCLGGGCGYIGLTDLFSRIELCALQQRAG